MVYQMGNTATTTMEGRQARKTVKIEEVVRSAFMTPPLFALGTMHTDRCSPARSISRLARTKAVVTLHGLMNSIHRGDHLDLLQRGALKLQWASLGGMDITFKVPAALRVDTYTSHPKFLENLEASTRVQARISKMQVRGQRTARFRGACGPTTSNQIATFA